MAGRTLKSKLTLGAGGGWLLGGAAASAPLWVEAVRRFSAALDGGTGEGALWGGPAFFALLRLVLPSEWTLCGALVGGLLVLLWPSRREGGRSRP